MEPSLSTYFEIEVGFARQEGGAVLGFKSKCYNAFTVSRRLRFLTFSLLLTGLCATLSAGEVHVAVASNFNTALQAIATAFEGDSGHIVLMSQGSSGKQFSQIKSGAPFALFLSADVNRAQGLETEGFGIPGSRVTYAIGRLSLWCPGKKIQTASFGPLHDIRHLALANPHLAPYGSAALQTLETLGLSAHFSARLVYGENIAQTFLFVSSGAAEAGIIARSQTLDLPADHLWHIPEHLHEPILQQAVLLKDQPAARALLNFLVGAKARAIILQHGYDVPETQP